MIRVKSGLPDNRVALWERHPDHPGGEVFIAGLGEYDVAPTPAVQARLKSGALAEIEKPAASLTTIKGVGAVTANRLQLAGIQSPADLLDANANRLAAEIGATVEQVESWQAQIEALD